MEERYLELIKIINEADYNYHTLDNPTITDQEYDSYLRELNKIEEEHPEIVDKILIEGTAKAQKVAKETMKKVKNAMKLNYFMQ